MKIEVSKLPDEIFVDEQITLRIKSLDSFELFEALAKQNRDHLYDWLPWAKNTPDASSYEHYKNAADNKSKDESCDYDIIKADKLAGAVGFIVRDKENPILEIGYWLEKDSQGQGIITRCVCKLIDVAFDQTNVDFIEIGCDKQNLKSQAVAIRCGLVLDREVDREPEHERARLETGIGQYYRITREQWNAKKD